jgi:hypothetical protein
MGKARKTAPGSFIFDAPNSRAVLFHFQKKLKKGNLNGHLSITTGFLEKDISNIGGRCLCLGRVFRSRKIKSL